MKRKLCVVTGSRAEYGLLRWLIAEIATAPDLDMQIIATGMHLSPEFGLTYREIEQDGFSIDRKIEILTSSDSAVGIAKSMGLGLIGFGEAYEHLRPDLVLVLGDRFEIFAAAAAAHVARIPIAHIHGGELTEGAFDDALRHSITKMAHLHFVAAEPYRQRVIQLGEEPARVFTVGALGLDSIKRLPILDRAQLEKDLDFRFGEKNLLVTFHPSTLDGDCRHQMEELLAALAQAPAAHLLFTLPNADPQGREFIAMIEAFVKTHPYARAYPSLGQTRYFSAIRQMDAVVGNSSSGLLEVPFLGKPTINIGTRQQGRLRPPSVIDCPAQRTAILEALHSLGANTELLDQTRTMLGDGTASQRILQLVRSQSAAVLQKKFYDLPFHQVTPS